MEKVEKEVPRDTLLAVLGSSSPQFASIPPIRCENMIGIPIAILLGL